MRHMSMSSYDRQQGSEVGVPAQVRISNVFSRWLVYIGTRERHLESILQSSLSQIILVKNFPRSLIQIVLQVEDSPENDYVNTKLVQASLVSRRILGDGETCCAKYF
jgi:hypothetical protein